jgi:hypothetical protein
MGLTLSCIAFRLSSTDPDFPGFSGLGWSRANGSERPDVLMTFLGGVAKPGRPADELEGVENRLAAGSKAVASFGRGSMGIGGIVDLDEPVADGVGRPLSGMTIG